MNVDELYESIKAERQGKQAEAEADKVSAVEVEDYNQLQKAFGLPELTPEAAAEVIKQQRAGIEAFKAANPMAWAEAEARAADSREWARLRREHEKRGGIGGNQQ